MAPGIICFLSLFSTKHVVEIIMALSQTIDVCYENNIYVDLLHVNNMICISIAQVLQVHLMIECDQSVQILQSTQANVKQKEMIDMKTSWHAFISGYICCRIYMITIEKRIDFLYLYFFFRIHISLPISSQLSRYLLLMSE